MNKQEFIKAALETYPDLTDSISRQQVLHIMSKYNLKDPHLEKIGRGMFAFHNTVSENTIHKESDQDIEVRIKETYQAMDDMVRAVAANAVNSLVISGGAGLGKSYGVNKILNEVNSGEYGYVFHRGYLRGSHLFRMLWENRFPGQVIVLDDVDLWEDQQTLNLLKAALELKSVRKIGWGSEKIFEDQDGEEIPRYFDYEGSIIFLTNLKIRELIEAGNKNSAHLSAIESRSLVLDLKINSKREYLIKIKQTIRGGMLQVQGFNIDEEQEILEFVEDNLDSLQEISLRMVEKIARIYRAIPDWKVSVRRVCFK
nr:MAG: hypothetical protein [Caudoviricetes sp.]